jgi:methionine aminopeptidase
MEWVLIVSIYWAAAGVNTPSTNVIEGFASEDLCKAAKTAVIAGLKESVEPGSRVNTLGRVICVQRK